MHNKSKELIFTHSCHVSTTSSLLKSPQTTRALTAGRARACASLFAHNALLLCPRQAPHPPLPRPHPRASITAALSCRLNSRVPTHASAPSTQRPRVPALQCCARASTLAPRHCAMRPRPCAASPRPAPASPCPRLEPLPRACTLRPRLVSPLTNETHVLKSTSQRRHGGT